MFVLHFNVEPNVLKLCKILNYILTNFMVRHAITLDKTEYNPK